MDEKALLVTHWLVKAAHDLAVARRLSDEEPRYLDIAVYHCQQAAEKAIKGFLVQHDLEFPKTHDIRLLVQLARPINAAFSQYEESAELLTPYATEFRYPGNFINPVPEEMSEALKSAEVIVNFVISLLPQEIQRAVENTV
jgi:HEPN domain-containing protein